MPDEAEVAGLLALLLLHDARRETRVDAKGDLVLLADQDRTRWDHEQIAGGVGIVERALRRSAGSDRLGPYQLQAAIAAVLDELRPPTRPTGARSPRCTASSAAGRRTRSWS